MRSILKKLVAILLVLSVCLSLSAAQFNSIPLGHRVYTIISAAEARGLVDQITDVKPYSYDRVITLLNQIYSQNDKISEQESQEIIQIKRNLERAYGNQSSTTSSEILKNGFYRTATEDGETSVALGFYAQLNENLGKRTDGFHFDSRNKVMGYIKGDLFNLMSYDINIGLTLDSLDARVFLMNDFTMECEGFYYAIADGGDNDYLKNLDDSTSKKLWTGIVMYPEVNMNLFNGILRMRMGSIKRDWGPGLNNLELAGSARSFDGIEFHIEPSNWFRFSVVLGSLGKFSMDKFYGRQWYSDYYDMGNKSNFKYDNNFSAQRIEVSPTRNLTIGIYESVVWKKRFELGYINPLSIYMFSQNALGDLDNMMAGLDFTYTIPGVAKFYGVMAMDEMNSINPKTIFVWARNILAFQGGAEIPVGLFSFSKLTAQITYIPPFFGAHYEMDRNNPWNAKYNNDYVNKGQFLGYPMEPDSMECLLQLDTLFAHGWTARATTKYQMRSAQYSDVDYNPNGGNRNGTTLNTKMDYGASGDDYNTKKFFNYIWSHVLSVEMVVSKTLDDFPLTVSAGLRFEGDWDRSYTVNTMVVEEKNINYGYDTVLGDWVDPVYGVYASLGCTIYM